jgi:hypothetical protein
MDSNNELKLARAAGKGDQSALESSQFSERPGNAYQADPEFSRA